MLKSVPTLIVLSALAAGAAHAAAPNAQYPNRPVRIVTGETGGAPDLVLRLMTPDLVEALGQQVIVDDRGGAAGILAAQAVARAPADGYTLLFYASALWLSPVLNGAKDDPLKDFAPISLVTSAPNVLVVHPSLPVKSVKELIAFAKSHPGQLNYGSGGVGGSPWLAGELFKVMAGVDLVRIGYKGGGPAVTDLLGGQLQLMFASATSITQHIASGRVRALGVTSPGPSALAPGLPTVAASGLPGFETQGVYALFAPVGTPKPIINLLQQQVRQAVSKPEMKPKFLKAGVEPVGSTAEELDASLKKEIAVWGKLYREGRIKAD